MGLVTAILAFAAGCAFQMTAIATVLLLAYRGHVMRFSMRHQTIQFCLAAGNLIYLILRWRYQ